MGQANDPPLPEHSKHTPLGRGNEAALASQGLQKACEGFDQGSGPPAGSWGPASLRPDNAPGNAPRLNGTVLPDQIAQGHRSSKETVQLYYSKDTRLSKNDGKSE